MLATIKLSAIFFPLPIKMGNVVYVSHNNWKTSNATHTHVIVMERKSQNPSSLLFTRVGLIKVDAKYETLFIISIGINAAIVPHPSAQLYTRSSLARQEMVLVPQPQRLIYRAYN